MNTQEDCGMVPPCSPQEVADKTLLCRLSVLEASLHQAGQGLRSALVFEARQRIMQLTALDSLVRP